MVAYVYNPTLLNRWRWGDQFQGQPQQKPKNSMDINKQKQLKINKIIVTTHFMYEEKKIEIFLHIVAFL
jgi:hypothetical protein